MTTPASAYDLRLYLRIETTVEDQILQQLVDQATAAVRSFLDRPIEAEVLTFKDRAQADFRGRVTKLLIPVSPVKTASPAPVVVDRDGDTVPAADYTVDGVTGEIDAEPGITFGNGPYLITATVGWAVVPDYATRVEPVLARAILDLAAEWYHRRNPGAASVSAGGGAATTYSDGEIPLRLRSALAPYKLIRGA